jgi:predicted nucleic acid-binding protein
VIVVDASVVVAALVASGREGGWSERLVGSETLAAPHLLPAEVVSALRRAVDRGVLAAPMAAIAHDDLLRLDVALFAYEPLAERVWQLRANLTPYDAWYVALAERLDVPLATLDARLAGAPGLGCPILHPSV